MNKLKTGQLINHRTCLLPRRSRRALRATRRHSSGFPQSPHGVTPTAHNPHGFSSSTDSLRFCFGGPDAARRHPTRRRDATCVVVVRTCSRVPVAHVTLASSPRPPHANPAGPAGEGGTRPRDSNAMPPTRGCCDPREGPIRAGALAGGAQVSALSLGPPTHARVRVANPESAARGESGPSVASNGSLLLASSWGPT